MSERAIKLYGTDEPVPEQRVLTAGPVTATLESGQLRWIRIGEAEAIRAIAFIVRDRIWGTPTPQISNLRIEESGGGFAVSFDALCRTQDGDIAWHGEFTGTPDGTIRCLGVARPEKDFLTGRTGFVILHPLKGVVGNTMTVEHTDGTVEQTRIPEAIVPDQPFLLVRAMTHEPMPGVRATIRMEGDSWETEDHRNWTDASLKTYCRPLSLPWPYTIPAGSEVRHTVTLSFTGNLPTAPAREGGPVSVRLGGESGRMPKVGLSVLPEDAERALGVAELVKLAGPQHLNCRIDLREAEVSKPLAAYRQLAQQTGAEVVLEIIIPGERTPPQELAGAAAAVGGAGLKPAAVVVTPAADLKSYPPGTPFPPGVPGWEEIAAAARAAFPGVRLGGGMLSNFTELNRKRPPKGLFDFITHATSALVHAADDRSVMETLESIGHIIRATKALIGDAAYRIGPSHIGNSFNPYGATYAENPDNRRIAMARVDPRHRGLFGAAWHLGFLSQVAKGGIEAATLASPVGEFGIAYAKLPHAQPWFDEAKDARVYPVYHVIRGIAAAAGATHVAAESGDSERLRALAWRDGNVTHLWLANLREVPLEVRLEGVADKARLWMLDEATFDQAVRDPRFADGGSDFSGTVLKLGAFAVARLDIAG